MAHHSPPEARRGFTLVEILLTVVVLGIGSVMVQTSLLRSAGIVSRTDNLLRAQVWMDEKLWEAREKAVYAEFPSAEGDSGSFVQSRRTFDWSLEVRPAHVGSGIDALRLVVRWPEGADTAEAVRETYVLLPQNP